MARRLVDGGGDAAPMAQMVLDSIDQIAARVEREVAVLREMPGLTNAGLAADPSGQLYRITGALGSWKDAAPIVEQLRSLGWVTWHDLDGHTEKALYRATDQVTLVQLDEEPIVLELTFSDGPLTRLPQPLRPSMSDVSAVDLPASLWPLYTVVRPLRLIGERTGKLSPRSRELGPILSTPRQLIAPLLKLAGVTADDHLIDLGCGEGRVVIEAARQTGCRVTGVETDSRLVERARRTIEDELGTDSTAAVAHGDARTFDLSDATAIFLFVPAEAIAEIVSSIRTRGFSGRIVSHEQAALQGDLSPESSMILTADGALTVAHLW